MILVLQDHHAEVLDRVDFVDQDFAQFDEVLGERFGGLLEVGVHVFNLSDKVDHVDCYFDGVADMADNTLDGLFGFLLVVFRFFESLKVQKLIKHF